MYDVIGSDGAVYGPVDDATLRQWASEGRLTSTTWLVDKITNRRFMASELADLFPTTPPPSSGTAYGGALHGGPASGYANPMGGFSQPYGYGPLHGVKSSRTKLAGILLAVFLGALGIHRFYIGDSKIGVIQLLITVLSCGILGFVSAIWGYVDAVMIATGSLRDDRGLELA